MKTRFQMAVLGAILTLTGCDSGQQSSESTSATMEQTPMVRGSNKVLINGMPAALGNDIASAQGAALLTDCSGGNAVDRSSDVVINGKAARRFQGAGSDCTPGSPLSFSENVLIGD